MEGPIGHLYPPGAKEGNDIAKVMTPPSVKSPGRKDLVSTDIRRVALALPPCRASNIRARILPLRFVCPT
jgi:hypothetical protein